MLEHCRDLSLSNIETLLATALKEVELIAELPISEQDLTTITRLLQQEIERRNLAEATQYLSSFSPVTVACFLVQQGISGYRSDFWPAVDQALQTDLSRVQSDWGQIFERVLESYRLPRFADTGGWRYVTPILGHGGIPDYCLPDFFARLLIPAATGRLDWTGNVEELLADWQSRPSLVQLTDKPVRRFLQYGGKAARDFLDRCLGMATEAINPNGTVSSATELGLPPRIVERFQQWLKEQEPIGLSAPRLRLRSPELCLDAGAGGLVLRIPAQSFPSHLLRNQSPLVETCRDEQPSQSLELRKQRVNGTVDTCPAEVPLRKPFAQLQVKIRTGSDSKSLGDWNFPGVRPDQPWMAFDSRTQRLITVHPIPEREFWLVSPDTWEIASRHTEEALLWDHYIARRVEIGSDAAREEVRLQERGGTRQELVQVDPAVWTQPYLEGQRIFYWPPVACPRFEIFQGSTPELVIPSVGADPSLVKRYAIAVSAVETRQTDDAPLESSSRFVRLQELLPDYPPCQGLVRLPLGDSRLLGPDAFGLFVLQVRGNLGSDRKFRICLLPAFEIHCPTADLLPDGACGPRDVRLRLQFQRPVHVISADPTRGRIVSTAAAAALEHELMVSTTAPQCPVRITLPTTNGNREVTLEIGVPRLEWGLVGLRNEPELKYQGTCREVTLQDLEEADDPKLDVQANLKPRPRAACLVLEPGQQKEILRPDRARHAVPLRRFFDTIRAHAAVSRLKLVLELADGQPACELDVLRIRTIWLVQDVEALIDGDAQRRQLYLAWKDKSGFGNRVLRLWHDRRLLSELTVADGVTDATLQREASAFPDGRYRLEFTVPDEWTDPAFPEDPYAENIQDLEIHGSRVKFLEPRKRLDDLLEAIAADLPITEFLDSRTIADFSTRQDIAHRFCLAVHERHNRTQDGPQILGEVFAHPETDEGSLIEALAKAVLAAPECDPALAQFFFNVFIERGILQQTWGVYLEELVNTYQEAAQLSVSSDSVDREMAGIYRQVAWSGPDFAVKFLKGLGQASGGLRWNTNTVTNIRYNGNAARYPLFVHYQSKAGRGNVELLARNWHVVAPRQWTSATRRYVLARFQRGLAWNALTCSVEVCRDIDVLGKTFCSEHPRNAYLQELVRAEADLRRWTNEPQGVDLHEP